jgi:fumarate reductase flavoprotein subunit
LSYVSETDLIVVGAGVAGWSAARRAQQLGLSVTVIDKFASGPGMGNGRMSGGVFHAAYLDPLRPAAEIARVLRWATDDQARPDVLRGFAENCRRAFDFLGAEGAQFGQRGPYEWNRRTMMPFNNGPMGVPLFGQWPGFGPDALLTAMSRRFIKGGGRFLPARRARELIVERDAVTGVETDTGKLEARNVLVADGGYHADRDFAARYYGSAGYLVRGSGQSMGDGLRMALELGAQTFNLGQFYGHIQHRAALDDPRYWPRPGLDQLAEGSLVVTGDGERIGADAETFMEIAHEIVRSPTPTGCWIIADAIAWDTIGALEGETAPRSSLERLGLDVIVADDITGIAEKLGIAPEALADSVRVHNASVGRPIRLPNSGEGLAHPPVPRVPAVHRPFRAIPVVVGITFGLGGILVNGSAQVLRDERPIAGLYAAGNAMGGLQGGPRYGYSGGWSQASTFGLIAAEHIASGKEER